MNRIALVLGAMLVVAAVGQGAHDLWRGLAAWSRMGPLRPGEQPTFSIRTLDGGTLATGDLVDRVTVFTFWATWCGYCREELVELDALDDRYADRTDVQFFAVNREGGGLSPREAAAIAGAYARDTGMRLPIAIDDGKMGRTFRVGPIPHTVVLDRAATIRYVHQGRVSADTLREEIDALLE